jgi:DNA-binding MarR family transcriptional regulator
MDINSIAILIKRASLEFDKLASPVLSEYDITPSQFKVLKLVMRSPEATVRQVDVERHFSMTNPTVTGLVNNLEKNGLVKRVPNPKDARSKVIVLTDKTKDSQAELLKVGAALEDEFTQRLDGEEKEQLRELLKKLLQ